MNSAYKHIKRGFAAILPVAASVIAYGSVLGVLASQKGVGWEQLLFMNLSIFAGSAQFVMVDMWNPPLPVFEIVAAVFIINFRYLLIGAVLFSILGDHFLPGKWYVVTGGALMATWTKNEKEEAA